MDYKISNVHVFDMFSHYVSVEKWVKWLDSGNFSLFAVRNPVHEDSYFEVQ